MYRCTKPVKTLVSDDGYPINAATDINNIDNSIGYWYDLEDHRIIITDEYLLKKRNEILNFGDNDRKVIYDECSEKVYEYVNSMVNPEDRQNDIDIIEYLIAKTEKGYKTMLKAQLAMVMYAIRSDGDELGDSHGVDIKNTTAISEFDKLREKLQISQHVKNILRRADLIDGAQYMFTLEPTQKRNGY